MRCEMDGHNGGVLMSKINENNMQTVMRASKPDMRVEQQNNSASPSLYFPAQFQFVLLIEI